jgi:hypothetical protein
MDSGENARPSGAEVRVAFAPLTHGPSCQSAFGAGSTCTKFDKMLICVKVTLSGYGGPRVGKANLGVNSMESIARIMAGVAIVGALGVDTLPALSQTTPVPSTVSPVAHHGAPGPIAGAGLPVVAVGFGVYWLIRRRRKPE